MASIALGCVTALVETHAAAIPLPSPNPVRADEVPRSAATEDAAPIPAPRPARARGSTPRAPQVRAPAARKRPGPIPAGAADDCRRALAALKVRFAEHPPISRGACGAKRPLRVTKIGTVALSTPVVARCPAALAFATWVDEALKPAARQHLRTEVSSVRIAASYVCRTRRNGRPTSRLSEHALANAVDVSAVTLASGRTVEVRPRGGKGAEGRFQKAIRSGACERFTTVLGPGSDPLHDNHFHFDMAERRSGFRLCR